MRRMPCSRAPLFAAGLPPAAGKLADLVILDTRWSLGSGLDQVPGNGGIVMTRGTSWVPGRYYGSGVVAVLLLLFCAGLPIIASGADDAKEKEKARAEIIKTTEETLSRLYKAQPQAQAAIAKAAGYAVFSNFGMKIFLAGGGTGTGVAVNNVTKKRTYMKMVEVQAGLGIGIKKFRLVWVFENQKGLDAFIDSGWELGGQTTAAAQASGQGAAFAGAMSIAPGIWLYQLTDEGLALELTAKGTKYYKDRDLN
jgi:lipid-binding SYLF domain-containing protein